MTHVVPDLASPAARHRAPVALARSSAPLPPHDGMAVSEAEYWRCYADWPDVTYEWHDGRLEAKGVSDWATILVFQWFTGLIRYFLDSHGGGQLVNQELGFSFTLTTSETTGGLTAGMIGGARSGTTGETHRRSIRRPDTAVILPNNPEQLQPSDRTYRGVFDLCLEALSDSDPQQQARDQVVKVREYAQAGVAEYYILSGNPNDCAFYRRDHQGRYARLLPNADGVMASTALPGLRWRMRDLVRQPPLEALLADPVYRSYVLPEFSQARAEKAAALARADQADARAERLAERLRQLGIDPLD